MTDQAATLSETLAVFLKDGIPHAVGSTESPRTATKRAALLRRLGRAGLSAKKRKHYRNRYVQVARHGASPLVVDDIDSLRAALRAFDLGGLVAQYSGYGDSGSIESITCYTSQGAVVHATVDLCVATTRITYTKRLGSDGVRIDTLEAVADEIIDTLLPAGFEIDEGGCGTVLVAGTWTTDADWHEHGIEEYLSIGINHETYVCDTISNFFSI